MTLPDWMNEPGPGARPAPKGTVRQGFVETSLGRFASATRAMLLQEGVPKDGFIQRLEPRARLSGFLMLAVAAALTGSWLFLTGVIALALVLSAATRAGAGRLVRRALPVALLTALLAAPASTGFVTPGRELVGTGGLSITAEGAAVASFFVLRVSALAAVASLAALTTGQADLVRGMGRVVPAFFVTTLFFAFKYALILVKAAEDAALARKSRTIDRASPGEARRWFASRGAFLLKKSLNTAEEVTMAMASRGFDGRFMAQPSRPPARRELLWLGAMSFVLILSFGV